MKRRRRLLESDDSPPCRQKDGSVGELHADDSGARSLFFKNLAHTSDGSARANGRHKRIDFALFILPNLHGRRAPMNLRASGISELIEDDGIGEFRPRDSASWISAATQSCTFPQ